MVTNLRAQEEEEEALFRKKVTNICLYVACSHIQAGQGHQHEGRITFRAWGSYNALA